MFWIILYVVIILALIVDEKLGIFDPRIKVVENNLIIKRLLKEKIVDINSITNAWIFTSYPYADQLIQVKTRDCKSWITTGRITFFNYKMSVNLFGQILKINPNIEMTPHLKEYLNANSIGNYYVNQIQIKRGLLLLVMFVLIGVVALTLPKALAEFVVILILVGCIAMSAFIRS